VNLFTSRIDFFHLDLAWFKIDATHNAAQRLRKNTASDQPQALQTRMPVLADNNVIVH
jgi:hypothetical protein